MEMASSCSLSASVKDGSSSSSALLAASSQLSSKRWFARTIVRISSTMSTESWIDVWDRGLVIGIRALSYKELGLTMCILKYTYILISVFHIEPNLAERARISAINLDDYQLDPVTPPPSPSSSFTMAAYQRMIAEMGPTQREEALTETGQNSVPVPKTALTVCTTRLKGQLHTILEDIDHYPNACLEELEAFLTLWDVKPRVEESSLEALSVDELITQLRQMCEDAEDRA
ncbi:hypothetical protein Tco_0315902, partial [Tanacetum coccineum]